MRWVVFLSLACCAALAQAEVYECVGDDGAVTYQGRPCLGAGGVADLPPLSISNGASPGVAAAAAQARAYLAESAAARARANTQARHARRDVAGVACPLTATMADAIDDHRVLLCMTPSEVEDAEDVRIGEVSVHRRLLPTGPSVVEWVYHRRPWDWPRVIRFRGGYVIGFSNTLPDYDD